MKTSCVLFHLSVTALQEERRKVAMLTNMFYWMLFGIPYLILHLLKCTCVFTHLFLGYVAMCRDNSHALHLLSISCGYKKHHSPSSAIPIYSAANRLGLSTDNNSLFSYIYLNIYRDKPWWTIGHSACDS